MVKEKFDEGLEFLDKVFYVSSKTGNGIDYLVGHLKYQREKAKRESHARYVKNFYVVGYANTGKSSLINAINKETNKMGDTYLNRL